jgi:hypothetical protein
MDGISKYGNYSFYLVVGSVFRILRNKSYPSFEIKGGIVNSPFMIFLYNFEVSGSSNGKYL